MSEQKLSGFAAPIEIVLSAKGNFMIYQVSGQTEEDIEQAVSNIEEGGHELVAPEKMGVAASPYNQPPKFEGDIIPTQKTIYLAGEVYPPRDSYLELSLS